MSTITSAPRENVIAGIGWMLATAFWFVSLDSLAKFLLQSYPVTQVLWARFFFHLLLALVVMGPSIFVSLRSGRPSLQLARSVLLVVTTWLFFTSLQTVPLATVASIMFLTPLVVSVLAVPLLGETVGPRRIAGVLIGFLGALIIVRPGFGEVSVGILLVLAAAMSNSLYQLVTRQVRHYDSTTTTLFYTALVGTAVFSTLAPFEWQSPQGVEWLMFVALGLFGGVSQLCLIRAFRLAPAAAVAPFSYTGLLWATLFGYVIFAELPDPWTMTGAALIVASGLYVFHREHAVRAASPPA